MQKLHEGLAERAPESTSGLAALLLTNIDAKMPALMVRCKPTTTKKSGSKSV
jgi:hypothetical protein